MYPTDRASAAQARPTRELTGAAHAGTRATSSAASPAIMAICPRLSDHRDLLAFWQRSLRQSSGESHGPLYTQDSDPKISQRTLIPRSRARLEIVFGRLGASTLQFAHVKRLFPYVVVRIHPYGRARRPIHGWGVSTRSPRCRRRVPGGRRTMGPRSFPSPTAIRGRAG